jgi:hypothetical protein
VRLRDRRYVVKDELGGGRATRPITRCPGEQARLTRLLIRAALGPRYRIIMQSGSYAHLDVTNDFPFWSLLTAPHARDAPPVRPYQVLERLGRDLVPVVGTLPVVENGLQFVSGAPLRCESAIKGLRREADARTWRGCHAGFCG